MERTGHAADDYVTNVVLFEYFADLRKVEREIVGITP
jgi:hypothetical protein